MHKIYKPCGMTRNEKNQAQMAKQDQIIKQKNANQACEMINKKNYCNSTTTDTCTATKDDNRVEQDESMSVCAELQDKLWTGSCQAWML